MAAKVRAKRMAPEERRDQILDAAARLILSTRHSGCTLEQAAAAAGVSKPLIYKYFARREDLLRAILEREFRELRGRGLDSLPDDISPESAIRYTVERALAYYFERGPIIRLLSDDPAVAELVQRENRASRTSTTTYFIRKFMKAYDVPEDVAQIAVTMVVNAPVLSVPVLRRRGIGADRTSEVWSTFIIGGWKALEERFGRRPRRGRRTPVRMGERK